MTKNEFHALLKRKISALTIVVLSACAIAFAMYIIYKTVLYLLPSHLMANWESSLDRVFADPAAFRERLLALGERAPWFFVGAQILQVVFAPVPGQAVALGGGYVFGFWKGWGLTTLGLTVGSLIAMALARVCGEKLVRRVVPDSVMRTFDNLLTSGGYTTFFMIFLLPALPDDAVCFIAGLMQLKLLPLSLVCLAGRAPGMAVLSLLGAELTGGLTLGMKLLFTAAMIVSVPLWLFWEEIEKKIRGFALGK